MAQTQTGDLFIPEVVGQKIATDYGRYITVSKFATVDDTLVGRAGDTITRNQFQFIGAANVLAEGAADTPAKLESAPITKKIVKVSKQAELTDESILAGADNPYGEAIEQLAMAIAIKDDMDAIAELMTTTQTANGSTLAAAIVAGMKIFGERGMKIPAICFVNSTDYYDMVSDSANWIPASEISARLVQNGVVGKYMGANIVPTDTVAAGAPVMMLEGALKKEMKRGFLAEQARILNDGQTSYAYLLASTELRVYWLMNTANAVKLTVSP